MFFSGGAEKGFKLVWNSMLELHLLERPLNSVCPESPPQIPRAVNSIQLHLIHRPSMSSAPLIAPVLHFIMSNLCLLSHSQCDINMYHVSKVLHICMAKYNIYIYILYSYLRVCVVHMCVCVCQRNMFHTTNVVYSMQYTFFFKVRISKAILDQYYTV